MGLFLFFDVGWDAIDWLFVKTVFVGNIYRLIFFLVESFLGEGLFVIMSISLVISLGINKILLLDPITTALVTRKGQHPIPIHAKLLIIIFLLFLSLL